MFCKFRSPYGEMDHLIWKERICDDWSVHLSDKRVCRSYINCVSSRGTTFCHNPDKRSCKNKKTTTSTIEDKTLLSCLLNTGVFSTGCDNRSDYLNLCKRNCKDLDEHCKNNNWMELYPSNMFPFYNYGYQHQGKVHLADGDIRTTLTMRTIRTARFYCFNQSIRRSQVCDSFPDCSDISDESQDCQNSLLSSDKELIGSTFLRCLIIIQCFLIFILNGKGLKELMFFFQMPIHLATSPEIIAADQKGALILNLTKFIFNNAKYTGNMIPLGSSTLVTCREAKYMSLRQRFPSYSKISERNLTNYTLCNFWLYMEHDKCVVRNDYLYSGWSECQSDECRCNNTVFRCGDGGGCISMKQVCNGVADCKDSSD